MQNSTFRVRVIEAPNQIIELFARTSRSLILRQRARILQRVGGYCMKYTYTIHEFRTNKKTLYF